MIRILKIHGRTAAHRRERLARVEAWMGEAGWRLGDFAEEAGSAMFERPPDAPRLPLFHATRWLPGPRALAPREWMTTIRADLRLAGAPAVVLVLLAVSMLSWLAPHSFLDQEALKQQTGEIWRIVDANQLNVREAPSVRAQQVGVLYRNQRVLIEGEVNDKWVRIAVPTRGYVAARFLKEEAASEATTQAATQPTVKKPAPKPKSQPAPQSRRQPSRPESAPEPPQPAAEKAESPQPAAEKTVAVPEPPQPTGEKADPAPEPPQPAAEKQVASPTPPLPAGREEASTASGAQAPPPPPGAPSIPAPPPTLPGSFPSLPPPPPVPSGSQ